MNRRVSWVGSLLLALALLILAPIGLGSLAGSDALAAADAPTTGSATEATCRYDSSPASTTSPANTRTDALCGERAGGLCVVVDVLDCAQTCRKGEHQGSSATWGWSAGSGR